MSYAAIEYFKTCDKRRIHTYPQQTVTYAYYVFLRYIMLYCETSMDSS